MISKQDLERLMQRADGGRPILSLFLDMSVNSDNKRTQASVFINQKQGQFEELDGSRAPAVAETFERVREWLGEEFSEENRGVVVYAEVGGDWFEALQFPVAVQNRALLANRPVIAPLAQVIESYHHHGVVLLDREHVRILSVYLGTLLDEIEVHGDPIPAPSHVQAGGYSQARFQRRKAEEMRHFFKEFAKEVETFVARYQPDDLIVLGTEENVAKFREFLPEPLQEMIVHTGNAWVDDNFSDIIGKLQPYLQEYEDRERQEVVDLVRDRVANDYLATAGFQGTLTALQEGKVDTLVLGRDQTRDGVRCKQCSFTYARGMEQCSYCGSGELEEVDAVEELVRMAEGQGVEIAFADPGEVRDLRGVGALLRF
ncbi:MAG TPA: VLRF1 family aeRF1-type release factor [Longimicrobiaceae bacterium]|nr:VLRF1 family aeRF1-type release factor [Longimicrobiaceae bacterium]